MLEEEKRRSYLRELDNGLEDARQKLKKGAMTEEEYIGALERGYAALSGACKRSDEEIYKMRREHRQYQEELQRLTAQVDMAKDKLEAERELSERRITEISARKELECDEKIKKAIDDEDETIKRLSEEWSAERDLLNGRLRAKGINDGQIQTAPSDRESFIELEKEYRALDAYYRKQWKKAKADIRKKEFLNRRKNDGKEGEE